MKNWLKANTEFCYNAVQGKREAINVKPDGFGKVKLFIVRNFDLQLTHTKKRQKGKRACRCCSNQINTYQIPRTPLNCIPWIGRGGPGAAVIRFFMQVRHILLGIRMRNWKGLVTLCGSLKDGVLRIRIFAKFNVSDAWASRWTLVQATPCVPPRRWCTQWDNLDMHFS